MTLKKVSKKPKINIGISVKQACRNFKKFADELNKANDKFWEQYYIQQAYFGNNEFMKSRFLKKN